MTGTHKTANLESKWRIAPSPEQPIGMTLCCSISSRMTATPRETTSPFVGRTADPSTQGPGRRPKEVSRPHKEGQSHSYWNSSVLTYTSQQNISLGKPTSWLIEYLASRSPHNCWATMEWKQLPCWSHHTFCQATSWHHEQRPGTCPVLQHQTEVQTPLERI